MNKFYITTTIPYVNGDPHIGHALEFVQADVVARYHRAKGDDVFFLTGTDENSIKNVQAAETVGKPVQLFVDEYAAKFKSLLKDLNILNNDFIRTTEERHIRGAQTLWEACNKKGDIYKKTYKGLYCTGCELFYLDKDLVDGLCPEHKTKPEFVEEENYFFRLSKYEKELERLITNGELNVIPEKRKNEMISFIRKGLEDFSISRSNERAKNWGVAVPGDNTQKMYVWFDALSNYINAIGYGSHEERFKNWWTENNNRVHTLGKGVARFHLLYWPAMLLSADLKIPSEEFVHGYITIEGEKMSKSIGNVINPAELVRQYGTDAVRYFLLRGLSAYEDSDFSHIRFEELYNSDLANGIGNFVQRVITLAEKADIKDLSAVTGVFDRAVEGVKERVGESIKSYEFNRALEAIWELVAVGDKYVNEQKPWELSGDAQKQVLTDLISLILHIVNLLSIFLPTTSENILHRFGLTINDVQSEKEHVLSIVKKEPLFKRLS